MWPGMIWTVVHWRYRLSISMLDFVRLSVNFQILYSSSMPPVSAKLLNPSNYTLHASSHMFLAEIKDEHARPCTICVSIIWWESQWMPRLHVWLEYICFPFGSQFLYKKHKLHTKFTTLPKAIAGWSRPFGSFSKACFTLHLGRNGHQRTLTSWHSTGYWVSV